MTEVFYQGLGDLRYGAIAGKYLGTNSPQLKLRLVKLDSPASADSGLSYLTGMPDRFYATGENMVYLLPGRSLQRSSHAQRCRGMVFAND
jgi:hypothetical protein